MTTTTTDRQTACALALADLADAGWPDEYGRRTSLEDPTETHALLADTTGRFLLIERNAHALSSGGLWLTRHDTPEDAAEAHDSQEYPEEWYECWLVDLETGTDLGAGTMRTTFGAPRSSEADALDRIAAVMHAPDLDAGAIADVLAILAETGRPAPFAPGFRPTSSPWNGNTYDVTVTARMEANTPDDATRDVGLLLAGFGVRDDRIPLSGPGSWAPDVKVAELVTDEDDPEGYRRAAPDVR